MTRSATLDFLRCVLPAEGYYCAVVFANAHPRPGVDKPRQHFFTTVEDLADFLLEQDRLGRTVYHACASYQTTENRKQSNVALVRSLWLDVDCDASGFKNKQPCYVDKQSAAQAVLDMSRSLGLPDPLFVDSGGGIHCYWPLETAIGRDEWQVYAGELKRLCVLNSVLADPARTSDAASILRTPGTHNRKNGDNLVQSDVCSNTIGIPVASLGALARPAGRGQGGVAGKDERVRPAPARPAGSIIARIDAAESYPAVFADGVAAGCAQLAGFRDSGDIPEPYWYACLGVLAFCADGEVKAHEWSQADYPGYDERAVDDRLHRARLLSGATTCAKLDSTNPGVCGRCPLWGHINSPVSVSDSVRQTNTGTRSPFTTGTVDVLRAGTPRLGDRNLPELKGPFTWGHNGQLLITREDNKGGKENDIISDFPVFLHTVQTGELENGRYSYKFLHWLPRGSWHEVVIEAKLLFGASGGAELADRGIVLHDHKTFLNYVRQAVSEFHTDEETHIRYDQFGWKNDETSFLYGKMLYTPAGPVEAIGAKEVVTRSQWIGPKQKGSLNAWTEAADSLFAADMEGYSAVVLASFAAPLMRFQSRDEGGAILHLFTPGSGQGKTTALTGAWTVWGTKEGLSLTNDDTRVAKPIAIGTLSNLPVIYDELRDRDPEVIKRMVVMFTEGRDRMRGMVDGTIRHTKATWQTILLSAANASLLDQLQEEGVDAPAFRVLELSSQLPASIDKAKGDRLKRILNDNAGHAGDAFLRYLTQPEALAWAKAALDKWTEDIWRKTGLDSPHRFRVRAVGAIAVAAAIVKHLELVHFNTDRIVEWLLSQLGAATNVGTVSSVTTCESAVAAFGAFINSHMGEVLVVPDRFKPKTGVVVPLKAPVNRLSVRYEIIPQRVFISETVFREWAIEKGLSPRHVLETLEAHQIVVARKRQITLSAGTNIPGAQVLCIEANGAHPVMSGLVASVEELKARVVDRVS